MSKKKIAKNTQKSAKQKYDLRLASVIIIAILFVAVVSLQNERNSDMLTEGATGVYTEDVNYFENSNGFLARPNEQGEYPGVIMIHEWWGLNDNIKDMARQLASDGYVVLAVDLYNGKVAMNSDEARQFVSSVDQEKATENMKAAVQYLKSQHAAPRVASLGWCFGGGQSLRLALSGEKMDATVVYYGSLVTNTTQLSSIDWPVLGIFGSADTSIPVSTVTEFDQSLDLMGVENEIYVYDGVGHAFANPSGMNYAPSETMDAWEKTLAFLNKHLKN